MTRETPNNGIDRSAKQRRCLVPVASRAGARLCRAFGVTESRRCMGKLRNTKQRESP